MKPQIALTPPDASVSPASPLLEVSGALLGIIALILCAAWLVKRLTPGGAARSAARGLKVSASAALGQRERLVIVEVEDARLVLGVTASQITLLHTLPAAAESEDAPPTARAPDFAALMKSVLKRPERS